MNGILLLEQSPRVDWLSISGPDPPGCEPGPCGDKIRLLHFLEGLLIDLLVVARHIGPLLKEWQPCTEPTCHIFIEELPFGSACPVNQRVSSCLNLIDCMPCHQTHKFTC